MDDMDISTAGRGSYVNCMASQSFFPCRRAAGCAKVCEALFHWCSVWIFSGLDVLGI